MNQKKMQAFIRDLVKSGRGCVGKVKEDDANEIRQEVIKSYKFSRNFDDCVMFKKDEEYELRAYDMMTNEEVLMSEARLREYELRKNENYLRALDKFEKESRKTRIMVSYSVA